VNAEHYLKLQDQVVLTHQDTGLNMEETFYQDVARPNTVNEVFKLHDRITSNQYSI
jgi:hypothetical protein